MRKLLTTFLLLGVTLASWASFSANFANGTLTINYTDDGNSNLNDNLIMPHMKNATTVVLTGDWANKDLSTVDAVLGKMNNKVYLDMSACTKMKSKVVKASDGSYSADIDWVTTEAKFIPTGETTNYTVDVTKNEETQIVYKCEGQTLTMPEGFDPEDHSKTYSPFTFNGYDGTLFWNGSQWAIQLQYYAAGIQTETNTTTTWTYEDENGVTHELQQWQVHDDGDGTYSYSYSVTDAPFKFKSVVNNTTKLNGIAFPNHADFNYIPEELCMGFTDLTSVNFGDYMEWIGVKAFMGCTALTNPTFPTTMKVFDKSAFRNCSAITAVNLSVLTKIQKVDYYAFGFETGKESNLATFTLPTSDNTSLKFFGNYVVRGSLVETLDFTHCLGIKNFAYDGKNTMNENVGSYDAYWTFYNCPELTTVILPPNLSYLTASAFNTCPKLTTVTFLGDADYDKSTCPDGGNVINNPLIIDEDAFNKDYALTTVNFCNRITEIRKCAFQNTGLTSVSIPASVEVIGVRAFSECADLQVVRFEEIDADCAPCKHARTVIAGEHRRQATDPETGELLFDETTGEPIWATDANGNIIRDGDGDGAFFNCQKITDIYIDAVDAEVICENKAFDYVISFGQTDPDGKFATVHYPAGEEKKYVNLDHYLTDEIAHSPGLFQAWLQAHYVAATVPSNNGWYEFINSGPSTKTDEPPYEDGDLFLRTFSDPDYARIVPKGVKAYIVKNIELDANNNYMLTLQSLSVIPKQTGVILFGQPNANAEGVDKDGNRWVGKTLAMSAVEFAPGEGKPLRRDYWDALPTELTEQQYQDDPTMEPDAIRLKNYLEPIIANAQIRTPFDEGTYDPDKDTFTPTNQLTVKPYEKVDGEVTFRNFALNRFSTTKTLRLKDEFKDLVLDDEDYAAFFRILPGTYASGYAYLHLTADEYPEVQGAECPVIKDEDYTKEYKGSTLIDYYGLTGEANPNNLWKYAIWENRPKAWGIRGSVFNVSGGALEFLGEIEDEADGIVKLVVPAATTNVDTYTLQGVKVTNPTKGVYIRNGKKVVIK